jgi:hypothetical protein
MSGAIRYALGGLLGFVAANAVGGGIYGLTGARGVPVEWLHGTPFRSYVVPSLILLVVVGGGCAAAAIATVARHPRARSWSLAAGAIVLGWIAVQVALIGYVSWLQPAVAIAGVSIVMLASALE